MASNHLEQLVAEWLEFRGYFVRRNVRVELLSGGGYAGELDIVAFNPESKHLVHYEASTDAGSWETREARFSKKFEVGRKHIPKLFSGLEIPDKIEQIALFAVASTRHRARIGGGRIVSVRDLLKEIFLELRCRPFTRRAVPEGFPLLRTLQLVSEYWVIVHDSLSERITVEKPAPASPRSPDRP